MNEKYRFFTQILLKTLIFVLKFKCRKMLNRGLIVQDITV